MLNEWKWEIVDFEIKGRNVGSHPPPILILGVGFSTLLMMFLFSFFSYRVLL